MSTWTAAKTADSKATIRARILAALSGAGVQGWGDNSPQRIIVDDVAGWLATEAGIRASLALSLDLSNPDASDDDWIDVFAAFFDATRTPAIAAVWDVPLTSTSLPLVMQPTTKATLQATGGAYFDLALSVATALPATLRFVARAPGTAGNVSASSLLAARVVTGPAGLRIAATPTLYTAGAATESNAALVTRCRGKWARRGAGWTLAAFDSIVPEASPTTTRWRVRDDAPLGLGTVLATLANDAGVATVQEVALVQAALGSRSVKPVGSGRFVARAATADAFTIDITVAGDGSNPTLATDIEAAILALCNAYPLGPASIDNDLVQAVALGGGFRSIPVLAGGEIVTMMPYLPGFGGAMSITSMSMVVPHDIPTDAALVPTINVTVT